MDKNQGKSLVAAAVFSLVITFASAAAKGDTCTGDGAGNCVGTGLICSTTCVCGPAYKENSSDASKCISKGLGDPCTTDTDCSAVTDSKCSATEPKKCECNIGFTAINNMCKRGLGDPCTTDSDCSAVTNSKCSAAGQKKCECNTGFTEINKMCKTGLGDPCTTDSDCSAVTNSKCSAAGQKKCECNTGFTEINKMCKTDGDASHASSNGLGDLCTADADCTAVTDSKCSATAPKKCECNTGFTAINKMCKIGLGNTCTNDASCSAVTNAECPATKKCACKANFKEDNGQCSAANGLSTLLSAPVALLLSFLTIVVTRLH